MSDEEAVPANMRQIEIGGLMRCCIATIRDSIEPTRLGDVVDCKYEKPGNRQLVVDMNSGRWRWNG